MDWRKKNKEGKKRSKGKRRKKEGKMSKKRTINGKKWMGVVFCSRFITTLQSKRSQVKAGSGGNETKGGDFRK